MQVLRNPGLFDVVVASYCMMSTQLGGVLTNYLWWRIVVFDEPHILRNDDSSIRISLGKIVCVKKIMLTGVWSQACMHSWIPDCIIKSEDCDDVAHFASKLPDQDHDDVVFGELYESACLSEPRLNTHGM